ncbi:glycosyltransferase [Geosporobacter ferrireducens]|uniref:Glycosyl transferase family 1 domain-containing protein n=1 Tax=Geosporobacter ferrireducens TaxID=1424294 RepID=A0A1D8GGV2_9FIRM|nr:glycosyltransferase [Geosporobacter ferrireducens]AOT70128.1 hypothetical protein Gferi_11320 [Geosporobacter ferrireducens]
MKILHIIPWGNGGIASLVKKLVKHQPSEFQSSVALFSCSDEFRKEIESFNSEISILNSLGKYGLFKYIQRIAQVIRLENCDVIHIHLVHKSYLAVIIAKIMGVEIIACHAHAANFGKKHNVFNIIELLINRLCIKLFCNKLYTCSDLATDFLFGKNMRPILIKNAVNESVFLRKNETFYKSLRNVYSSQNDELLLLHVGQFSYAKNHEYLICVCKELKFRKIKHKVLLAGTGIREDFIKELVRKFNLEDSVIFMGFVSNVDDLLNIADVFLFPSHFEGLPTVIVEAQACGLPSILSNTITQQCDLGLGLLHFESIESHPSAWVERILLHNRKVCTPIDESRIKNTVIEKGFTAKEVASAYYDDLKGSISLWVK